jgi:hypothetical protein
MRKRIVLATGMILVAMMILLSSCQSGGGGGNSTSKEDVTDPNVSFSNPGTRNETP